MKQTEIKVDLNTKELISKMGKATYYAKELKKSLEDLRHTDVFIEIVKGNKKQWYQFWK